MKIEIRPLSVDVLDDFLYFFDNITFHENPGWSVCYCYSFHFVGTAAEWNNKEKNRSSVIKLIKEKYIRGYLAYMDEKPIGCCNANDKSNYERLKLKEEIWDDSKYKICSIVCFLIDPEQRRKGIASKLLERVCIDYKQFGYDYVEAYPLKNMTSNEGQCQGPSSMYYSIGFEVIREFDKYLMIRKSLN